MADENAALLQAILRRNAASGAAGAQNPWDTPMGGAPMPAPMPSPSPAAPAPMGAAMSPEEQIAELIRQRQALANPQNPYDANAMGGSPLVQKLAGLLGR